MGCLVGRVSTSFCDHVVFPIWTGGMGWLWWLIHYGSTLNDHICNSKTVTVNSISQGINLHIYFWRHHILYSGCSNVKSSIYIYIYLSLDFWCEIIQIFVFGLYLTTIVLSGPSAAAASGPAWRREVDGAPWSSAALKTTPPTAPRSAGTLELSMAGYFEVAGWLGLFMENTIKYPSKMI